MFHSRTKHIDIRYHFIRDHILKGDIKLHFVPTDLQLARIFTKPLAEPSFTRLVAELGMFNVEKQSLIPPSGEVNIDDTANKSLSRASVQPVTQSKAPTDLKTKKKRIPPSSKLKSPYKVRVILPKKQVAETQHAEVTVATADATKSLVASELAEEQVNQPSATEAEKVLDQNVKEEVKDTGFVAMEEVTFEQIMDEVDSKTQGAQENAESPYDTESKIKIIKSYQAATISGSLFIHQSYSYDQNKDVEEGDASESLSSLRSMPDDDLAFISGFETQDSADHVSEDGTDTLHASAGKAAQSDPLGHLHAEMGILNTKIDQLESSISKKVAEDMKSFLLKDSIKCSISESISEELPKVEAQVQKNLHDQLPNILLKPMYKDFNAFNKLESHQFVLLQKELCKSLHNKMKKSIRLKDMVPLLEAAKVFKRLRLRGRMSHPAKAEMRGITSWISSQHNGVYKENSTCNK
ncbi:hypothetical protein Tco_0463198 [Tanacetum coccineum]